MFIGPNANINRCLHFSYPHKDKGYDQMMSVVFARYPQLNGTDVVESMVSYYSFEW